MSLQFRVYWILNFLLFVTVNLVIRDERVRKKVGSQQALPWDFEELKNSQCQYLPAVVGNAIVEAMSHQVVNRIPCSSVVIVKLWNYRQFRFCTWTHYCLTPWRIREVGDYGCLRSLRNHHIAICFQFCGSPFARFLKQREYAILNWLPSVVLEFRGMNNSNFYRMWWTRSGVWDERCTCGQGRQNDRVEGEQAFCGTDVAIFAIETIYEFG